MAQSRPRPTPPKAWDIVEEWQEWLLYEHQTIDKPYCFACGKSATWKGKKTEPKLRWNYARGLEKAHIVPHSLGGSNEVNNYFILCKHCHAHAPTTIHSSVNLHCYDDSPMEGT